MQKEIAVLLSFGNRTSTFAEYGRLVVYKKVNGEWQAQRSMAYVPQSESNLELLQKCLKKMTRFLEDCKIIVGRTIAGVPYDELKKAGCSVWERDGCPYEFLEKIRTEELSRFYAKEHPEKTAWLKILLADPF